MPRPRVLLLCLCLCGLSVGAPAAQTPGEFTVEQSVRLGLQNHPGLRAARAEAAEADAVRRQVRATRLPALRAQAGYTRLGGEIPEATFQLPGTDTAFTLLPVERNRYQAELSVEQPVFTGGRLQNQLRGAAREAEAAQRRLEHEEASVAFEVRRAYWTLSGALATRAALEGALARVDEHLRGVRARVDAGAALPSDLLAAQTRRAEVMLDQVEAENAVRVARLELNRVTGLPLDSEVRLLDEAVAGMPASPPRDVEAADGPELDEHPLLEALALQVGALRAQVSAVQGTRLPEVAVIGRYTYARPNPYALLDQDQFRGTWEAGMALQWSLWDGGLRPAQVSQARARLQGAEARLAQGREEAAVEVARQALEVRRSAEALEVAALNVREAEETFRVVRQQFDEGVALSTQVLDAEQAFRAALARRARARAEHAIAHAALTFARGRVW